MVDSSTQHRVSLGPDATRVYQPYLATGRAFVAGAAAVSWLRKRAQAITCRRRRGPNAGSVSSGTLTHGVNCRVSTGRRPSGSIPDSSFSVAAARLDVPRLWPNKASMRREATLRYPSNSSRVDTTLQVVDYANHMLRGQNSPVTFQTTSSRWVSHGSWAGVETVPAPTFSDIHRPRVCTRRCPDQITRVSEASRAAAGRYKCCSPPIKLQAMTRPTVNLVDCTN